MNAGDRRQVVRPQRTVVDNKHGRSAVADLARIGGGDHAALLQRLHRADRLERGVRSDALVMDVVTVADQDRHDLCGEGASLGRRCGALMTEQCETI